MKLHELLQGIEVLEQNADPELELTGVSYDSRSTAPGELFAAISGYATDGHRFIPAALARGAACVLCEHDMPEHTPWVRVRDARAALAQLGCTVRFVEDMPFCSGKRTLIPTNEQSSALWQKRRTQLWKNASAD